MWSLLLVASLAAAAPPVSLASPGWKVVNVSEQEADFFAEHLADALSRRGLKVTTKSQIESLLGFERQRQLLGCDESSSSCAAELAGALGVDGLILGNVARFGQGFRVDLRIVGAKDGQLIALASGSVATADAVVELIDAEAPELARKARAAFRPGESAVAAESSSHWKAKPSVIVPGALGVVGLAACGYSILRVSQDRQAIRGTTVDPANPDRAVADLNNRTSDGKLFQTVAIAGGTLAIVGLGSAIAVAALGGNDDVTVSAAVSPSGAFAALRIRLR